MHQGLWIRTQWQKSCNWTRKIGVDSILCGENLFNELKSFERNWFRVKNVDSWTSLCVCVLFFRSIMIPTIIQLQGNLIRNVSMTKINVKSNQAHITHSELDRAIVLVSLNFPKFLVLVVFRNHYTNSFGVLMQAHDLLWWNWRQYLSIYCSTSIFSPTEIPKSRSNWPRPQLILPLKKEFI